MSTVEIGRAVSGFRSIFYNTGYHEKEGDLYDLVLLLYVGQLLDSGEVVPLKRAAYIQQLAHQVRTASLQDALNWLRLDDARHEVRVLADSDYFLRPGKSKLAEEHGFDARLVNARPASQVPNLSDKEIVLVLHALHVSEAPLAKLMRPLRFLTHQENVSVAVQHARLWLLESELRVVLGMDITYADLKHLVDPCCEVSECEASKYMDNPEVDIATSKWRSCRRQLFDRLDNPDRLPSGTETILRLETLTFHWLARTRGGRVFHVSSAACPDNTPLFVKRILRLQSPYFLKPGEQARDWTLWWNAILDSSYEGDDP